MCFWFIIALVFYNCIEPSLFKILIHRVFLSISKGFLIFICMCKCFAYMHVHMYTTCIQCFWRSEEEGRSQGTRIRDSCELPLVCWESNSGHLQEQSELLSAELFLQPLVVEFH